MATVNPFGLLGDDDHDDPSHLIAIAQQQKAAASAAAASGGKKSPSAAPAAAKMPTKPAPPAQAVRDARNSTSAPPRGGGASKGGPARGRGGRGGAGISPNRDFGNVNENGFTRGYSGGRGGGPTEEGDGGKPIRGGGYGPARQFHVGGQRGHGNVEGEAEGDTEHPPRRAYERRSGTGRGYEMKREGSGRGNWGTMNDDAIAKETEENVNAEEKIATSEKQPEQGEGKPLEADKDHKENTANEEEAKAEDKEMTLDEYEKIREEKRKALLSLKTEERKVTIDKELESMQPLSVKKGNDEIFIKLGADKESKKRENAGKKSLSINEFLKPAEGERFYSPGGHGRGRGRGGRGGFGGGGPMSNTPAPAIEDPGQFPTLSGK